MSFLPIIDQEARLNVPPGLTSSQPWVALTQLGFDLGLAPATAQAPRAESGPSFASDAATYTDLMGLAPFHQKASRQVTPTSTATTFLNSTEDQKAEAWSLSCESFAPELDDVADDGAQVCLSGSYIPGRVLLQEASTEGVPAPPVPEPTALCGTMYCPSAGSLGHRSGLCTPCDFFHRGLCKNDVSCKFCHLCGPDVSRIRKRRRQGAARAARRFEKQLANGGAELAAVLREVGCS